MTFKLTLNDHLLRETPSKSDKSGSDLVRDFRRRFKAQVQAKSSQPGERPYLRVVSPTRLPR